MLQCSRICLRYTSVDNACFTVELKDILSLTIGALIQITVSSSFFLSLNDCKLTLSSSNWKFV